MGWDIAALYDVLLAMRPGVVTAVNRAVAIGEAFGAEAGLAALADAGAPEDWLPYQAARAGLAGIRELRERATHVGKWEPDARCRIRRARAGARRRRRRAARGRAGGRKRHDL